MKKIKNFIKQNKKEILIIVIFVIITFLIYSVFVDSYSCGDTRKNSINNTDMMNICLTLGYIGQSVFAGSLLVSVVLLYKALKK